MIRFDWDSRKNKANLKKHGISFEEAQAVFFDEDAIVYDDPDHSDAEDRFLIIGRSFKLRVLFVCYCYQADDSIIRMISARKATSKEQFFYDRKGKVT
jgi:uncharacterized DUF497 family protein